MCSLWRDLGRHPCPLRAPLDALRKELGRETLPLRHPFDLHGDRIDRLLNLAQLPFEALELPRAGDAPSGMPEPEPEADNDRPTSEHDDHLEQFSEMGVHASSL